MDPPPLLGPTFEHVWGFSGLRCRRLFRNFDLHRRGGGERDLEEASRECQRVPCPPSARPPHVRGDDLSRNGVLLCAKYQDVNVRELVPFLVALWYKRIEKCGVLTCLRRRQPLDRRKAKESRCRHWRTQRRDSEMSSASCQLSCSSLDLRLQRSAAHVVARYA